MNNSAEATSETMGSGVIDCFGTDCFCADIQWDGTPGDARPGNTSPEVAAAVKVVGYYGDSGTALLPDSTGVVGFVGGRLYFAAFAQAGQISSAVDVGAVTRSTTLTIKRIAGSALFKRAGGRFGLEAGNDGAWDTAEDVERHTLDKLSKDWGSGRRRCRGRPTATHFSLSRQRKVSKRKATRSLGPFATLRAPCGAQTQWGHVQTRLRLKQARALIHWVLRSSAQPERGFCLAGTVVFTPNVKFNDQANFITSQEPWQEVLVNAVDVRATTAVTMKTIAASAVSTRAGGRFDLKAGNDGVWEVAA